MNKLLRVILLCLLLGFGVQSAFADDLSIQKSADALKSQLQSELSICSNERGFELLKPATEKLNLLDYSQQGDSNFESVQHLLLYPAQDYEYAFQQFVVLDLHLRFSMYLIFR